jgi:hypothetical protein
MPARLQLARERHEGMNVAKRSPSRKNNLFTISHD